MQRCNRGLIEGPIFKNLLIFALPMILGNCLQQVYNIVDTLVVGRYIGKDALAAVGSTYILITFLTSLIIGLCMGSGAIFAHSFGSKNIKQFKKDIFVSFVFISLVTALIYLIVIPNSEKIMVLLNVPSNIMEETLEYANIIFLGLGFTFIYNFNAYILKAINNSKIPLLFLSISCFINIVLDLYFVINLHLGVKGAAIATLIAQAISSVGIYLYRVLMVKELNLHKDDLVFSFKRLKYIISNTLFTGLQRSIMNFGALTIQGLVNSFGSDIMASFAAVSKIDTFAFLPISELSNAYSIFISQNIGANNKQRIVKGKRITYITGIIFGLVLGILINIFAKDLMLVFVNADEINIINEGIKYISIVSSSYVLICILNLYYGHFRGIELPWVSFILSIVSLGTRNLISYSFAKTTALGVFVIYMSIPIGWLLADIVGYIIDKIVRKRGYY